MKKREVIGEVVMTVVALAVGILVFGTCFTILYNAVMALF